jgi:heptosyltransferase-2
LKTAVVLPNWVGDTVLALPVLDALGASERHLAVLGQPNLESLLKSQKSVAEFVPRSSSDTQTVQRLREAQCDEAVVLPNSIRSARLVQQADIPRRWGYGGNTAEGLIRRFLLEPSIKDRRRRDRHQVEDYANLLAAMQVAAPSHWIPQLQLSDAQLHEGRELVARAGLDGDRQPLIGLFPGAEFGPSKRWPWRRFAELAQQTRKRVPGCQLSILAGPKELWIAVRVHEESGKIHPVVGPDLDLGRLAAFISHLDLLVTNDSGPMHVAAALGVPTLAIFGPTDPRRTSPLGPDHQVLYSDRWCSPCFRKRCPLIHQACMRDITVDTVAARVVHLLSDDFPGRN